MPLLDATLKAVLVCPQCHGALEEDEANSRLLCRKCNLAYRVESGIPIMLIDEAQPIEAAGDTAAN